MRSPTVLMLGLLIFLLIPTYAQCNQQIFYKSLNHTELSRNQFDPKQGKYPVIQLSVDCPYYPVTSCPNDAFDEETIREFCRLQKLCPNGTQPQCVENKEYVWKDVLWICSPIRNCDRNARSIVYVDSRTKNVSSYQLGKEMCKDGYYHSNYTDPKDNSCFSSCKENVEIQVYQKRTANSGPIVYCNYQMGYCNAETPKLFELKDVFSPCHLAYEKGYHPCPASLNRLPDCTCDARCQDGDRRDPADDFKCKKESEFFPSIYALNMRDLLQIHQHLAGFRLQWSFQHAGRSTIETVTVAYRDIDDFNETYLNITLPTDNRPDYMDLEGLFPGKTYIITVRIMYIYEGKAHNFTFKNRQTTRPNPVVNLTASVDGHKIILHWFAPNGSWQDRYHIEYRMVRRNQESSWLQNTAYVSTYELKDSFPGEEYEFRVYSVSNDTASAEKSTGVIVPPLSPEAIQYKFQWPSFSVTIRWIHDETRSHVESWRLRFNSSGGEKGQRVVPLPDNGKLVEVTLSELRLGKTYTVSVQSSVTGVVSPKPARVEFNMPETQTNTDSILLTIPIIGIVVFIAVCIGVGVAVCVYLRRRRKDNRKIVIYNAELTSGGDININDSSGFLLGADGHNSGSEVSEDS